MVISKAQTAWNMMLSSVTDSSRVEYGFYIYYNHSTRQFYCGEIRAGATVYGCQGTAASLDLGRAENNRDVCAFYHCHTTLNKCPENCQRATGPSSEDVSFATSQGLPGLVEDYAVATLKGQMSAGLPHVIIPFGPTQRPDQEFPPISL